MTGLVVFLAGIGVLMCMAAAMLPAALGDHDPAELPYDDDRWLFL